MYQGVFEQRVNTQNQVGYKDIQKIIHHVYIMKLL